MPALITKAKHQTVQDWNAELADYARDDAVAKSVRFGAAQGAAKEARLAIGRIWFSVVWRNLWAAATAPRLLDPVSDAESIRAFLKDRQPDFEALMGAAALHFEGPTINRRTQPLTPHELEQLIEDDQRSIGR